MTSVDQFAKDTESRFQAIAAKDGPDDFLNSTQMDQLSLNSEFRAKVGKIFKKAAGISAK